MVMNVLQYGKSGFSVDMSYVHECCNIYYALVTFPLIITGSERPVGLCNFNILYVGFGVGLWQNYSGPCISSTLILLDTVLRVRETTSSIIRHRKINVIFCI